MTIALKRRHFLLGTAALVAQPLLINKAFAALANGPTPVTDKLTIKVITDSSYDSPRAGKNPWVKIKRNGFISTKDWRKALHSEWGLALALESTKGAETRKFLLDYGYTPTALLNNMELLNVRSEEQHGLILSHGHYDHFGGLIDYLKANRSKLPQDLTLYVGGEDNFCNRKTASGSPGHFADWGVLDRRELEQLNVNIVHCDTPVSIQGHAFSTGIIERTSFEKVIPNTQVIYAKKDGLGCDLPDAHAKAGGKYVADEHIHEHGTVFNLKDRGLVVISSCGHAGIVNTVQQAIKVSGVNRVHAILGGFHLFPAPNDYLVQTVHALKAFNPDVVIPLHCSGPGIITAIDKIIPNQLVTSTTGSEFEFGA